MKRFRFPCLLLAALAAPPLAAAAPLVGPALQSSIAGSEFRGYTFRAPKFENHIWRFQPDGTVLATFNVRVDLGRFPHQYDGSAVGRWTVEGDRVCIEWGPGMRSPGGCYAIDVRHGHHVRLIGPEVWEGTLQR